MVPTCISYIYISNSILSSVVGVCFNEHVANSHHDLIRKCVAEVVLIQTSLFSY